MSDLLLVPHPQKLQVHNALVPRPGRVALTVRPTDETVRRDAVRLADDLLDLAGVEAHIGGDGTPVTLDLDAEGLPAEGYRLSVGPEGVALVGADPAGLAHAGQTLLQLLALANGDLPQLDIRDWPWYRTRELMLDLGRAPFSMALLKRVVRIMSRLKLNSLHLHLNDDQLNGLRFERLPLGSENPWAITIDDLRQLVAYARSYHVAVVPEIECWGHAGSFVYHEPGLKGGPGMWGGFSFGLGEELFDLLTRVFDEIVPVLEDRCDVHVGLDEAKWFTLPSVPAENRDDYAPERLVGRLHAILQSAGERYGKQVRMRLWADHGGRPVPEAIRHDVVVEPWRYHEYREAEIREKVDQFGGAGKPPFMMGAGMSSEHLQGDFGATRVWAQAAMDHPNVEGIDLCLWESNDIANHLVGIFGGADHAWTPLTPEVDENDAYRERIRGQTLIRMKKWQAAFPDADGDAIRRDTGFAVHRGIYTDGPLAGRPVAPTAVIESPESEL